jgi:hypothetical protein
MTTTTLDLVDTLDGMNKTSNLDQGSELAEHLVLFLLLPAWRVLYSERLSQQILPNGSPLIDFHLLWRRFQAGRFLLYKNLWVIVEMGLEDYKNTCQLNWQVFCIMN